MPLADLISMLLVAGVFGYALAVFSVRSRRENENLKLPPYRHRYWNPQRHRIEMPLEEVQLLPVRYVSKEQLWAIQGTWEFNPAGPEGVYTSFLYTEEQLGEGVIGYDLNFRYILKKPSRRL